ncbi:MAG: hypothetical protein JWM59_696 [Verrucomicrobiales bacterium]|nr:hypothetical protein [Verrucomicrobiales bacterium]
MKITTLSLLLLSAVCAHSATVAVSRGGLGVVALTSNNEALSTGGYYIAVGSFTTVPTVTNTPESVLAAVGAFNEFASATSSTTGATVGTVTGSFTGGFSNAALYNGKEIFIMVGNGNSKANSTDFAILKGSTAWNFTADVSAADSIAVILRDVTSFDAVAGTEVDVADPAAKDQVQLWTAIPEVSSSVLVGLFGLGLMSRRRR